MKIIKLITKVSVALLSLLFLLLLLAVKIFNFGSFSMSDGEVARYFDTRNVSRPISRTLDTKPGKIHLVDTGQGKQSLVFIHGSPGSWSAFIDFFASSELRKNARLLSVDRPGFGGSDAGVVIPSLKEQARRISVALAELGISENAIILGHSLGGPVAVRLAVDYPELVSGLVLIAPSLDPNLEKLRWFNTLASYTIPAWFLPRDWRISNGEIMPLKAELLELGKSLNTILSPTVVIQGMEDKLVHPGNADYVQAKFSSVKNPEIQRIAGLNHFIPWERPDLIVEAALKLFSCGDC